MRRKNTARALAALFCLLTTSAWLYAQDKPPVETGTFRVPELVEIVKLDPSIKLDVRYATKNNFLGRRVYKEARAFLQRPAAEALVRVNRALRAQGYGLVIFDGYRPWQVTKIFWDATPAEKKEFVADPQKGSRHNRGCAVDLTLYDLQTGQQVKMPSEYDEMTERSHINYSCGSAESRRLRDLLRAAMEAEGFAAYEPEWWHYDYKDWREYPILNIKFNEIKNADHAKSAAAIVSIPQDGELYFGNEKVAQADLPKKLKEVFMATAPDEQVVYINAGMNVSYKTVVSVIDTIRGAGFIQIELIANRTNAGRRPQTKAPTGNKGSKARRAKKSNRIKSE